MIWGELIRGEKEQKTVIAVQYQQSLMQRSFLFRVQNSATLQNCEQKSEPEKKVAEFRILITSAVLGLFFLQFL